MHHADTKPTALHFEAWAVPYNNSSNHVEHEGHQVTTSLSHCLLLLLCTSTRCTAAAADICLVGWLAHTPCLRPVSYSGPRVAHGTTSPLSYTMPAPSWCTTQNVPPRTTLARLWSGQGRQQGRQQEQVAVQPGWT